MNFTTRIGSSLALMTICASLASAQVQGIPKGKRLEGKVPRNYSIEGPKLSKPRLDFKPIVADPRLAEQMAENPPEVLTSSEYEALQEERRGRLQNRFGRSMNSVSSGAAHRWSDSEERERGEKLVRNEDVEDDSMVFVLWLVGGVFTVGGAFFFWRRSL